MKTPQVLITSIIALVVLCSTMHACPTCTPDSTSIVDNITHGRQPQNVLDVAVVGVATLLLGVSAVASIIAIRNGRYARND